MTDVQTTHRAALQALASQGYTRRTFGTPMRWIADDGRVATIRRLPQGGCVIREITHD